MKIVLLIPLALLACPAFAQTSSLVPSPLSTCGERPCASFNELWKANDASVHNASWVCTAGETNNLWGTDTFILFTADDRSFRFEEFGDGNAVASAHAVRDTNGKTTWGWNADSSQKVVKDGQEHLHANLTTEDLTVKREFTDRTGQGVAVSYIFRLSTGRFLAEFTSDDANTGVVRVAGKCNQIQGFDRTDFLYHGE